MKRRSVLVPVVTVSAATYYTVPENTRARLVMLHAAPTGATTTTPTLGIKVGADTTTIVTEVSLATGSSATYFSDNDYIMLEAGTLVVAHSNNTECSLIITVEEETSVASTF
jgi:hypothetical protein